MTSQKYDPSELLRLCGKVRDGDISPDEFARLEDLLLKDPNALQTYRQFMALCSGLEQTANMRQTEEEQAAWSIEIEASVDPWYGPMAPSLEDKPPSADVAPPSGMPHVEPLESRRRSRRRNAVAVLTLCAIAASAMFALLGFPGMNVGRGFAKVESVEQPVWANDRSLSVNANAAKGEYALASGAVKLRYRSGVDLLVQAPARFTFADEQRFTLRSGVVSLYVPPNATGFRIDTPFGSAIDRGTRIGVIANEEIGIELHVFEGQAELVAAEASKGQVLMENEAAALAVGGTEPTRIKVQSSYFAKSLLARNGLPKVTGDVELRIRPPRSVRRVRAELVDRGRATVFLECRGIELQADLPVTTTSGGEVTILQANDQTLPKGAKVDSYLVHFVLPRDAWNSDQTLKAQGSIAFDRPIAAVIANAPAKTRDEFGHPNTEYPGDKSTGLEDAIDGDSSLRDRISISEDRRTLRFRFHLHGRDYSDQQDRVDQCRVLLESNK